MRRKKGEEDTNERTEEEISEEENGKKIIKAKWNE